MKLLEVGLRKKSKLITGSYETLLNDVSALLVTARKGVARSVNSILVATYLHVGRSIVIYEQAGEKRADYGKALLSKLSSDLTSRYGRGFSKANLEYMRRFYTLWPIPQTLSGEFTNSTPNQLSSLYNQICQTPSAKSHLPFPLPWSHCVRLLSVEKKEARNFYEQEACLFSSLTSQSAYI